MSACYQAWPRQPIPTDAWLWKVVQSYRFRIPEHINLLEERAFLNYLRRHIKSVDRHRQRFLCVFDSQVVAAVTATPRSSSVRLSRILRRTAGIHLAAGFFPYCAWTRSALNPADAPSRKFSPHGS